MIIRQLYNTGCIEDNVRLHSSSSIDGRAQICISNQWQRLCPTSWDGLDAAVVCIQLGLPSSSENTLLDYYMSWLR